LIALRDLVYYQPNEDYISVPVSSLARKVIFEMTYKVLSRSLNPTITE